MVAASRRRCAWGGRRGQAGRLGLISLTCLNRRGSEAGPFLEGTRGRVFLDSGDSKRRYFVDHGLGAYQPLCQWFRLYMLRIAFQLTAVAVCDGCCIGTAIVRSRQRSTISLRIVSCFVPCAKNVILERSLRFYDGCLS